MGRRLSQGIRIYEHGVDREMMGRDSYNFWQGMSEIEALTIDPSVEILAIGTESGAMTVHYRWLH
jgi:hypothetical protein